MYAVWCARSEQWMRGTQCRVMCARHVQEWNGGVHAFGCCARAPARAFDYAVVVDCVVLDVGVCDEMKSAGSSVCATVCTVFVWGDGGPRPRVWRGGAGGAWPVPPWGAGRFVFVHRGGLAVSVARILFLYK